MIFNGQNKNVFSKMMVEIDSGKIIFLFFQFYLDQKFNFWSCLVVIDMVVVLVVAGDQFCI